MLHLFPPRWTIDIHWAVTQSGGLSLAATSCFCPMPPAPFIIETARRLSNQFMKRETTNQRSRTRFGLGNGEGTDDPPASRVTRFPSPRQARIYSTSFLILQTRRIEWSSNPFGALSNWPNQCSFARSIIPYAQKGIFPFEFSAIRNRSSHLESPRGAFQPWQG